MSELPAPERDTTSIVLVGSFNPRIFQPAWFVAQGLLPPGEGADADVQVIANDICIFQTDWCRIEVLNNRFSLTSISTPVEEVLRDLVIGTFRILEHAPVTRMGINASAHFQLTNVEVWHQFGHLLAPKESIWEPILDRPGTLTLTVEGRRPDDHDGHVRVKVEPSTLIPNGIFIESNDEFRSLESISAKWVAEILESEWEPVRSRAMSIRYGLIAKALEGE